MAFKFDMRILTDDEVVKYAAETPLTTIVLTLCRTVPLASAAQYKKPGYEMTFSVESATAISMVVEDTFTSTSLLIFGGYK